MCLQTPRLYGFCHVSHGVYFIPPKKRLRLLHVMCGLKNAAKFQRTQIWEFRRDLKLVWLGWAAIKPTGGDVQDPVVMVVCEL
mmetsp:Transcript_43459/g.43984  ORF Transcript_43459/g.43984 Transcript_43459/m.43984 type:complete len:83 (-) Transcript_43459:145-393(-)